MNNLQFLTSKDLFFTQREAFHDGDMKTVKKIAEIARSRINKKYGDWEKAKMIVSEMAFPHKEGLEKNKGEFHKVGKNIHCFKSYELYFKPIEGFVLVGYYNYCEDCSKVRNKKIVIYNNQKHIYYEKVFMKHGEDVFEEGIERILNV